MSHPAVHHSTSQIDLTMNSTLHLFAKPENDQDDEVACFNGTTLETVPSLTVQIFLVNLYILTSILSLCGNVTVILVQLYGPSRRHSAQQNIRRYLINLALSDLIIGVVCVPFNYTDFVLGHWIYPHWLCPTVQYVQPLCVFITSLTLSLIGLERYLYALHPLSSAYKHLQANNRTILISTWIAGLLYSYLIFGQAKVSEFYDQHGDRYFDCSYSSALSPAQRRTFMTINFVLTFAFPFVMLTYSYMAIAKKLLLKSRKLCYATTQHPQQQNGFHYCDRQQQHQRQQSSKWLSFSTKLLSDSYNRRQSNQITGQSNQLDNSETIKNRLKTIKMLLTIILLYSLCWMPIKIYQFLLEFDVLIFCSRHQFYTLIYLYIVCHWLAMANSCVNPVVYAVMNNSFRYDFWKISRTFAEYIHTHCRIRASVSSQQEESEFGCQ